MRRRVTTSLLALSLAGLSAPAVQIISTQLASATQSSTTSYSPGTPEVDSITDGTSQAPWNTSQGDSSGSLYSSQSPGALFPTFTPGGATTGTGSSTEPNVAVYPGANSGTAGDSPYPSGTVGTPGPLDGYCGTGSQSAESVAPSATSVNRQPTGEVLPFSPYYFPHVTSNGNGILTGLFDYRPKDADEAVVAATSSDGGKDWTYDSEALEQNPEYCPSDDINDDGEGHANVITVGGTSYLYTLERAAGDNSGVGMIVHKLSPTASNPLAGAPAVEKTGIDPDDFASAGISVPFTGGTSATINFAQPVGTGNEQLVAGEFVDLTQTPVPTASSVINCTAVGAQSLTGCTTTAPNGISVQSGDLIEQVIGVAAANYSVPSGPNNSVGSGGLAKLFLSPATPAAVGSTSNEGFTNPTTGSLYNADAPNRAYIDGVAVYCDQANNNPTTELEDCTTGPGGGSLSVNAGDPVTSDPIVPATAYGQTSGLVAPDGIVGVLPSYPGAPAGSTIVMYTEKELGYYVAGETTKSGNSTTFPTSTPESIIFNPSASESADLPSASSITAASPLTVEMGDSDTNTATDPDANSIQPVTCTGLSIGTSTDTLTGCTSTAPAGNTGLSTSTYIGAPGATTVPESTLALTGEGSAGNAAKLFKNNEDLTVLRVAYTTDGISFSTAGLANGGVISGAGTESGSTYNDINNPSSLVSPSNLNAYAAPGTADATEMRFVGSAGTIITNADGSYGLFLSGAWAADGDSDAFNQVFYSTSTDGQHWSTPVSVLSTDYTFAASEQQAANGGALGVSAYYSGRAYGPSVVQNPDGSLTMVFAGYRIPKTISDVGTSLGTGSTQYTIGANDPVLYRNILTVNLACSGVCGPVASTPETPYTLALPVLGAGLLGAGFLATRRRRRLAA